MNEIENQKKEQCTEQKQEIQKKKKRKYETPKAIFEKYTPDQSISACYNIACEYGMQGGQNGMHAPAEHLLNDILIPRDMRKDDTHSKRNNGSGCGWSENQVVELDSDHKVRSLKEINVQNYKTIDCDVILQDGNTVYWTTKAGNDRMWSHMGRISYKNIDRPNMS